MEARELTFSFREGRSFRSVKIRELNMPLQGEPLPAYGDCDTAESCTMDQCMERAKEMMNWDEKYPCKDLGNGKVRGVGVAMAMQGSSIAGIDVGGADMHPDTGWWPP